jgi:Tol biopolymer transport system component
LRKLRDNAWLAAPSPDGSSVAFISADYREIWLMNANGEEPRRLLAIESGATFAHIAWAPNGQQLAYLKHYSLTAEHVIETCDLKGGHTSLIWSDRRLRDFCWTPQGRIIGTLAEPNPDTAVTASHSDLWEVDVRKGRAANAPRRLTNFTGFRPLSLSVTADGKQLALIRNYDQSDVYVGELEANASRLIPPQRFTLDDRIDWPGGWTRDSKAVLFYSDRQGTLDLFRQRVEERIPELLLAGSEERREPQMSPDGSWILYLAWPRVSAGKPPGTGKLMQIPVSGGPPQVVFNVKGYPGSAQVTREFNKGEC